MVQKEKKIWMDGELTDWDEARVHVLAHTLHYGLGAFEGIRAYRRSNGTTTIFRLRDHMQRLLDTCKLAAIEPRFDLGALCDASVALLRSNSLDEAYLRPLVFLGDHAMGVYAPENPVRTAIMAWRWGAYLGTGALERGVRTKISTWLRHHPHSALPRAKITGQYTNSILAKREARIAGYDEAILLNASGFVCEGSGENLFIVKDGALVTPPLAASILAGITRATILELAREDGIPIAVETVARDQLYLADEAFFTGTAVEVTPVVQVDDRDIGTGRPGPVTQRLQQRYFDVVKGSDESHPEWFAYV